MAVFNRACHATRGWLSNPLPVSEEPSSLRFTDWVENAYGQPTAVPDGGVVASTFVEFPIDLAPEFDHLLIAPDGGSDVLVASYTATWIQGCNVTP